MRAVLVICEGRSDIAFSKRSLTSAKEFREVRERIGELPSPFGASSGTSKGIIARHIENCFGKKPPDEMKLPGAAFLSHPQFDAVALNQAENVFYFFCEFWWTRSTQKGC